MCGKINDISDSELNYIWDELYRASLVTPTDSNNYDYLIQNRIIIVQEILSRRSTDVLSEW